MAQLARIGGRLLPLNDWEGDDFVPGSGGSYVTCMDTSAGRMVAFATNGRIVHDGKVYRRAIRPPDPNGVNYNQMQQAVHDVAHLPLTWSTGWTRAQVNAWLKGRKGLMVTGWYEKIPRAYRHQAGGSFLHEMFVSNKRDGYEFFKQRGTLMRLYDPLDPRLDLRGRTVPTSILWPFLDSSGWMAGYVPLQPL